MIKIVESGFYSCAHEEIKQEISNLTDEGKKSILIVPEQQTVTAERELAEFLPCSAPLYFEAANFTRLADSVFRRVGGIAAEYSDRAKESLIMWKTLTELQPFLSFTDKKGEITQGLVNKALSAVFEMKGNSTNADMLEELTDSDEIAENGRLLSKLSDLSKIMALYDKTLHSKYSDSHDDVDKLADITEKNPEIFSGYKFFIEGFTSFTAAQMRFIRSILPICDVTVVLPMPKECRDLFEFSETKKTEMSLIKEADKLGITKKLLHRSDRQQAISAILPQIAALMWQSFGELDKDALESASDLRIFEARDPYEECNFIAEDIKRRIFLGDHYRDFAIVLSDAEEYSGILDTALSERGIPHFFSKRRDVFSFEAIKLIYTALAIVRNNFKREDVISYLKCGICGIDREACDEFELYTEKWQISRERFVDGILWNMNPDGLSGKQDEKTKERLERINATREKLILPLIKFSQNIEAAKTVREYATALVDFMQDISLKKQLDKKSEMLYELGEEESAAENSALWGVITSAINSLVEVLSDMPIDTVSFENQLKVVISATDFGKIPANFDEVTVGEAKMLRTLKKKHVYLIGVNQGKFPKVPKDDSYFSDRDKMILSSHGIRFDTTTEIAYARELHSFSRAFCLARKSVTLLYTLRDSSFSPTSKSDVIDRICAITQNAVRPVSISELPEGSLIYTKKAALSALKTKNEGLKNELQEALLASGVDKNALLREKNLKNSELSLSKETTEMIYPKELSLTQSRIDSYVDCPFAYYLRYNLGLAENEKAEFNARNIGTFVHAILENFFEKVNRENLSISSMTEEERERLTVISAKKYLSEISDSETMRTERTALLINRISRASKPIIDGICDELRDCDFKPMFFELKIGTQDPTSPTPATFESENGEKVFVYGSIDRVDTYKHGKDVYVRVIDYKTGAKNFSPSDIDDGKNLQMFLYLKSIADTNSKEFLDKIGVEDGGRVIPAGVIYIKTDISDVKVPTYSEDEADAAIKKKQERKGMILNDPISIGAMNPNYLPVKYKKDGTPTEAGANLLYTDTGWQALVEKISGKVCQISHSIKTGDIRTTEDENDPPCSYCKYKAVCRASKE